VRGLRNLWVPSHAVLPEPNGVRLGGRDRLPPHVALGLTFQILNMFRMTTFFLIAGVSAHLTFHRRGANGFIANRAKRIAVPLLVGWA
jgi:hypothetical protein